MHRMLVALLLLWCPALLLAQERILAYDSEVEVHADGSLDVREHITVRAEGSNIRRGIYRDFPTRYTDRYGNRVVVDLDVVEVLRDGKPEPWFAERIANGVRINTGNDDFLRVPAEYAYTLHYRTSRQLGFFAGHDELYWNAIGTGWNFAIESGGVDVTLPQPVPVAQLHAEGYTGPQGAKGQDYDASLPAPGKARWRLTRPLMPREGLTIVLGFPKGLVAEPSSAQRLGWLLQDNRGILTALAGFALLLAYCMRRWLRVGRDPAAGVVFARYEPPQGHSPAELRYIRRMGHDNRCFSCDLLALAVAGYLRIEREKGFFKDAWKLVRLPKQDGGDELPPSQAALLSRLFANRATLDLEKANASIMQSAQSAQAKALQERHAGRMFKLNGGSIGWAVAILVATGVAAFAVGAGAGIAVTILVLALMLITVIVFAFLVRAPTAEGRRMLDEIAGLALYLGVAEREELANMPGPDRPPQLDAPRYERLLPYAVALDVEDAWTKKFTLAVGAAAAAAVTAGIAWYRGGGIDNLGSLSKAVGSSLSSQIASSSTPPGSSSGGGGGGSSGGGGGGGGGGGR